MLTKVTARVTNVGERSKYYPESGQYFESTLDVIDNPANISGSIRVREQLALGAFYSVIINTSEVANASLPIHQRELEARAVE